MTRHNTLKLENSAEFDGRSGMDSFAAVLFQSNNKISTGSSKKSPAPMMKKKTKDDSEKMEELQMKNEALANHLSTAYEDIERLKNELRVRQETSNSQPQIDFRLLPRDEENVDAEKDAEGSNDELENTL